MPASCGDREKCAVLRRNEALVGAYRGPWIARLVRRELWPERHALRNDQRYAGEGLPVRGRGNEPAGIGLDASCEHG